MLKSSGQLTLNFQFHVKVPPNLRKTKLTKHWGKKCCKKPLQTKSFFASPVAPITPFKHTGFLEDAVNKVTVLASQGFRLA